MEDIPSQAADVFWSWILKKKKKLTELTLFFQFIILRKQLYYTNKLYIKGLIRDR